MQEFAPATKRVHSENQDFPDEGIKIISL